MHVQGFKFDTKFDKFCNNFFFFLNNSAEFFPSLPGGELHLGEAGKEVIAEFHGAFMCREGRQVPGGELHLGEEVDDEVPGAFMCREGRQVAGKKGYLDLSQVIL